MAEETFNICTTGPALAALLHSMALQGQRDYDGLILGEFLLGCQSFHSQVGQPVAWPRTAGQASSNSSVVLTDAQGKWSSRSSV